MTVEERVNTLSATDTQLNEQLVSEQLSDSILSAVKDFFNEKGYKLLRSRRYRDKVILVLNRER